MRTFFLAVVFVIVIGLGFVSVTAQSGVISVPKTVQPTPASTPTPEKNKKSSVVFPDVEGWTLGEKNVYPTKELGYSQGYKSDNGSVVTVYVYNNGYKTIPDDLTGVVIDEMTRAKNDIQAAGRAGYYTNIKEVKDDSFVMGGTGGKVKALRASYTLTAGGEDRNSEIYLFAHQNDFIKVRVTTFKSDQKAEAPLLATLFSEIDALFAK